MALVAGLLGLAQGAWGGEILRDGACWDWQLTEPFDLSVDVKGLDLDPDSVSRADILALKARGVKTACHVSVGTVESDRDAAGRFPEAVMGAVHGDWPDERFLDIRQRDVLLPLMKARFDACRAKGFDAIEPDNMDLFENDTGLPLTAEDQVAHVVALARYARSIGMEIARKNAPELIGVLEPHFGFLILESCFHHEFCEDAGPYLAAGKDVLAAEYPDRPVEEDSACAWRGASGVRLIFKARELAAGGRAC